MVLLGYAEIICPKKSITKTPRCGCCIFECARHKLNGKIAALRVVIVDTFVATSSPTVAQGAMLRNEGKSARVLTKFKNTGENFNMLGMSKIQKSFRRLVPIFQIQSGVHHVRLALLVRSKTVV